MTRKTLLVAGTVLAGILVAGGAAFAQANPFQDGGYGYRAGRFGGFGGPMVDGGRGIMKPGIAGRVAAISGTTLTVTSRNFMPRFASSTRENAPTSTEYSVDASNATVTLKGASSTVGAISVGDFVFVSGTVNGTNVAATSIEDGGLVPAIGQGRADEAPRYGAWSASGTKQGFQDLIQGNGEPVVGGSVTAISGSTLTVTTKDGNITYTIDAANATVVKGGATSTVAGIGVGDGILAQGSISGTSMTATSIIDQGAPRTASSTPNGAFGRDHGFFGGMMNAIGGFFHRFFGFF